MNGVAWRRDHPHRERALPALALVLAACAGAGARPSPPPPGAGCEGAVARWIDSGGLPGVDGGDGDPALRERTIAECTAADPEALSSACDREDGRACFALAVRRALEIDPGDAGSLFARGCEHDHVESCASLAMSRRDPEALRSACEAGSRLACEHVPSGDARDGLLEASCARGHPRSCLRLAESLARRSGAHARADALLAPLCAGAAGRTRELACSRLRVLHVSSDELEWDAAALAARVGESVDALEAARLAQRCGADAFSVRSTVACERELARALAGDIEPLRERARRAISTVCRRTGCREACSTVPRDRLLGAIAETNVELAATLAERGCGGAPDPECAYGWYRAACDRRAGHGTRLAEIEECAPYLERRAARGGAPPSECARPVRTPIRIAEATSWAAIREILASIRTRDDIGDLLQSASVPGLPAISADGRTFAVAVPCDPCYTLEAELLGARRARLPPVDHRGPESDEATQAWVERELLPFWDRLAAELEAGGFRRLETMGRAGPGPRVVITDDAAELRIVDEDRVLWRSRSRRACEDISTARVVWDRATRRFLAELSRGSDDCYRFERSTGTLPP